LKIVHIITRLILGGAQENTLITCKLLAERGHDVTLITGPALGPEGQLFDQAKGQKYAVLVVSEMRRAIRPVRDFISYYKVKGLLGRLRPDIVHTHSAKAGIVGRYAGWSLKGKWAPVRPAVVHTIHGLAFHPYQSRVLNQCYIAAERAAARRTDHFISVADAMTDQAKAAGIGVDKPYVTAYSAIDEDQFLESIPEAKRREFRRQHDIPDDAVVLVTIARLFVLKGHDYIIESARELSQRFENCIWLFVGDGNLTARYKRQIEELGLADRFRFTGLMTPDEVPLAIQSSDILVHCSLREGLARTLPFDVDGAREVVNGNTGRLIEPKNIPQLTEACAELIADKTLRETLGQTARESVKQKFAPDTMVDTVERVYETLLAGTNRS